MSNNNELISIIVPVYNVQKYLDRCMNTLLNQTYKNIEIILIDDESPDSCPQMCDEYKRLKILVSVVRFRPEPPFFYLILRIQKKASF